MLDKKLNRITYTCVGHCCMDVTEDGYVLGGTASYSAALAHKLGYKSSIISAYGDDFLFESDLESHVDNLQNLGKGSTTIFENIYGEGARRQVLHSIGKRIDQESLNTEIHSEIIHLCPIADEIDYGILSNCNAKLIGATIQGSLRAWDDDGMVFPKAMDWNLLNGIDVVIISNEDVLGLHEAINHIKDQVPIVIVTEGRSGAYLHQEGEEQFFPSFPIVQLRETGAGDTFATAFFIQFYLTRDAVASCKYAHVVASLVLERTADDPFPNQEEILSRMKEYEYL